MMKAIPKAESGRGQATSFGKKTKQTPGVALSDRTEERCVAGRS